MTIYRFCALNCKLTYTLHVFITIIFENYGNESYYNFLFRFLMFRTLLQVNNVPSQNAPLTTPLLKTHPPPAVRSKLPDVKSRWAF